MTFLEKDLEEIIYTSDNGILYERGLYITGKLRRQVRIGNYGIADLVEYNKPRMHPYTKIMIKGEINVIELKQDKIGISAFLQALGYLQGIRSFLSKKGIDEHYNYKITLIGKTIDNNSNYACLAEFANDDFCERPIKSESGFCIRNYIYNYGIDGIFFEEKAGVLLSNEGF